MSSAAQFVKFISRTVLKRTPKGKRQSVIHEGDGLADFGLRVILQIHLGNTVRCHLRADGLGAVMVSDGEYPERVSFSVLSNLLDDFATQVTTKRPKSSKNCLERCGLEGSYC